MGSALSSTVASIKDRLTPAAVCCIAFLINVIAYYPGFLTSDSLDQYQQTITRPYKNWHPPAFTLLWQFLNKIHEGPFLLLLMQLGLLWGSGYLLMKTANNKYWRIAVFIFCLAPFVQNFAGCVVKDSQMALTWLFSFALLFRCYVAGKRLTILAACITLLLLLYGTMVRVNALPGAIPLYLFWAYVVFRGLKKVLVISIFSLLCLLGAIGNAMLEKIVFVENNHPQNKLYLHDLAGIFVRTGDDVYPALSYSEPSFDTAYIRQHYTPATYDNIFWNKEDKFKWSYPVSAYSSDLQKAWIAALIKHPGAYLAHRFDAFLYFLKIKSRDEKYFAAFTWIHPNPYGFKLERNFLWYVFVYPILAQRIMFYMRPWFWVLLCAVLFSKTATMRRYLLRLPFLVLLSSALLYILPQFFISQTDIEFRYVYWSCIAIGLAFIMYVFRKQISVSS